MHATTVFIDIQTVVIVTDEGNTYNIYFLFIYVCRKGTIHGYVSGKVSFFFKTYVNVPYGSYGMLWELFKYNNPYLG